MASAVGEGEDTYSPCSQLPGELLHLISQKLSDDMSDFIRFRCVCRSWRHAAKPSDLPPQLPWLLLPYDPESSSRSFFSIADESTRTLLLPETLNQNICGSSNGWLIMHDKALNISLFNPIPRSLIRLPPITMFTRDKYVWFEETLRWVDRRGEEVSLETMNDWLDCFASVSSDPGSVNAVDGVVALMGLIAFQIQYCRLGDAGWTVIDPGLGHGIKTLAFHKGNFYFVDCRGRTSVCELGPVKKDAVMIPPANLARRGAASCHYLVTLREELLLVSRHMNYLNLEDFSLDMFEYHKLEVGSGGTMTWSPIGGAGDCSVFLTDVMFRSRGRVMTVASSAPGYRKDCVYYVVPPTKHYRTGLSHMQVIKVGGGDIGLYNGPWTESKPKPMSSSWIVPSLY